MYIKNFKVFGIYQRFSSLIIYRRTFQGHLFSEDLSIEMLFMAIIFQYFLKFFNNCTHIKPPIQFSIWLKAMPFYHLSQTPLK